MQLTLSVSLHAPDNVTRSSMMPVNDAFPLEKLIPACRRYQKTTGRRISFEYSMVNGVNDSPQGKKTGRSDRGMGAHVNLIPINPVDGSPYSATDEANVRRFQKMLEDLGVNATIRRRLGTDISAACGQLRARRCQTGRTSNTANDERKDQRTMKIAALTDIGSCRQENQDNYCARQLVDGTGWGLVCDGMGGANGGRVASTLATQTMLRYFDHSLAHD